MKVTLGITARHWRLASVLASLALLGGCASGGNFDWQAFSGTPKSCAKIDSDNQLALNLAQDMANEGRLHAALANLEALPDSLPDVRLRKARVMRQLGQSSAEPLYRSLLGTCQAAEGEHGLGQLAAAQGHDAEALTHLLAAMKLAPTDDKIRNDLGVVYLNQKKLGEARFQFVTAMELQQDDHLAAVNLMTLMFYQGDWQQATELVNRFGLSADQVSQAQARATQLKDAPAAGAVPITALAPATTPTPTASSREVMP